MEMHYFYICDLVKNEDVKVIWHPGQEKLGDYASKHHDEKHYRNVRPIYTYMRHNPQEFYHGHQRPVLCEGVLELYQDSTYVPPPPYAWRNHNISYTGHNTGLICMIVRD